MTGSATAASAARTPSRVGIEKLGAYPCAMALDFEALAEARGHDPADLHDSLMVRARSVNPPWEDPVTMAVNAALPMLDDEDRASIELLIVATESGVDGAKPISTFAQRYLGIQSNCRNFEVKHGCYAGTSAVMTAAYWIASGLAGDAKALVLMPDQSRMHFGQHYEFVAGAGAAAVLLSNRPRVLELEPALNGYWTEEVSDVFRPTTRIETGQDTAVSVYCYLDALEGAFIHYQTRCPPFELDTHFKKYAYHGPFGGLALLAHRHLLRRESTMSREAALAHFQQHCEPGLEYTAQMGGTYSSSVYLSLLALIDRCPDLLPGDRVAMFSYGSGSCGEFFSGRVCPEARETTAATGLQAQLDARYPLTVAEYEAVEEERTRVIDCGNYQTDRSGLGGLFETHYAGRRRLFLRGVSDYFRQYEWS